MAFFLQSQWGKRKICSKWIQEPQIPRKWESKVQVYPVYQKLRRGCEYRSSILALKNKFSSTFLPDALRLGDCENESCVKRSSYRYRQWCSKNWLVHTWLSCLRSFALRRWAPILYDTTEFVRNQNFCQKSGAFLFDFEEAARYAYFSNGCPRCIGNCRCSETLEFGPSTKVQTHKVSTIIAERWIVFEY